MKVITSLQAHPAAELFPLMNDSELMELAEDIRKNGLLEPITLHEGKVLDGRNRLAACDLAGVEPTFQEWNGLAELPTRYVIAKNLPRRHLSIGQRAAIAAESVPILAREARERQGGHTRYGSVSADTEPENKGLTRTREIAGAQVGVSGATVQRAMEIRNADPELFEKVKRGEVEVRTAHRKIQTRKNGNPQCSLDGCERDAYRHELCRGHYQRKRRTGSVGGPGFQVNDSNAKRIERIREMAPQGYNSEQIAEEIGISAERVRLLARQENIRLFEASMGLKKKIDINRMVEQTVIGAENLVVGLEMIDGKLVRLKQESASQWAISLESSIRVLARLLRELKQMAGEYDIENSREVIKADRS